MKSLQKIKDLHQKVIYAVDEKIRKTNENREISNSGEKLEILIETRSLVDLTFDTIYANFPEKIKDLPVSHSSSGPAVQQLETILNSISFDLLIASNNSFRITSHYQK